MFEDCECKVVRTVIREGVESIESPYKNCC